MNMKNKEAINNVFDEAAQEVKSVLGDFKNVSEKMSKMLKSRLLDKDDVIWSNYDGTQLIREVEKVWWLVYDACKAAELLSDLLSVTRLTLLNADDDADSSDTPSEESEKGVRKCLKKK